MSDVTHYSNNHTYSDSFLSVDFDQDQTYSGEDNSVATTLVSDHSRYVRSRTSDHAKSLDSDVATETFRCVIHSTKPFKPTNSKTSVHTFTNCTRYLFRNSTNEGTDRVTYETVFDEDRIQTANSRRTSATYNSRETDETFTRIRNWDFARFFTNCLSWTSLYDCRSTDVTRDVISVETR